MHNYYHGFPDRIEDSEGPDQLASSEASWSGYTLFPKEDIYPGLTHQLPNMHIMTAADDRVWNV